MSNDTLEPSYLDCIALAGRDAVIKELRRLLKDRTGRTWSVTGGRGSSWGWISVSAPPKRREKFQLTEDDYATLRDIFGRMVGTTGYNVPDSSDHRAEALRLAAGLEAHHAEPYWD